jgi:zinc transporter 2
MATLKNRRDFFKLYTPPVPENNTQKYRKLIIVIVLSLSFVATEIVAGVVAHSISIISDAIHLICDVLGYFSSFLFLYLSRKAPNKIMTFGYHRMELLGALSNIFIVWTLILFVIFESTHRILNKEFVEKPLVMMIAATADLLVNIAIYKILHQGPTHSHGLMASPCQHNHHHHDHHEHPDLDSH